MLDALIAPGSVRVNIRALYKKGAKHRVGQAERYTGIKWLLLTGFLLTLCWSCGSCLVFFVWMGQEDKLVVSRNPDGTVTYQDGPDQVTTTNDRFFAEAVENSLKIVLFCPTLPYFATMICLGIVGVYLWFRKPRAKEALDAGWGEGGESMAERLARMRRNDRGAENGS
jgi:hypothetical protein